MSFSLRKICPNGSKSGGLQSCKGHLVFTGKATDRFRGMLHDFKLDNTSRAKTSIHIWKSLGFRFLPNFKNSNQEEILIYNAGLFFLFFHIPAIAPLPSSSPSPSPFCSHPNPLCELYEVVILINPPSHQLGLNSKRQENHL